MSIIIGLLLLCSLVVSVHCTCEERLQHCEAKYGTYKAHAIANHTTVSRPGIYTPEQQAMLTDLRMHVKDSNELQKLLDYAKSNYDIPTMKAFFELNGYLIFKPKIPEKVMKDVTDFTAALGKNAPEAFEPKATRGHSCPAKRSTCIHDRYDQPGVVGIANDWSIRAVIAALYERTPYSYQSLNYPYSSQAFTHSDYVHFGSYPADGMTAAWVALEDIHADAGPLFYYPRSHKMPYINMQDFMLKTVQDGDYPKYQDRIQLIAENLGFKRETFLPKKGEALIWHGNLLHGGPPPNNMSLTRHSIVVHFHFYENEYNWQAVGSRLDQNKVLYINEVGVHQVWGRLPALKDGSYLNKAKPGTCFDFKNSPCTQSAFELGIKMNTEGKERCPSGHGYKNSPSDVC